MSYTKNTWQTGDTITAAKLNHMEDGIEGGNNSGGVFWVEKILDNENDVTLNKTAGEIVAAFESGAIVVIKEDVREDPQYYVTGGKLIAICGSLFSGDTENGYRFRLSTNDDEFYATSLDQYPTNVDPDDVPLN